VQFRPSKRESKLIKAKIAKASAKSDTDQPLRALQTRKCPVCSGTGRIERKRASEAAIASAKRAKLQKPLKSFKNWVPPGPEPAHDVLESRRAPSAEDLPASSAGSVAVPVPADCSWDPLVGKWVIAQPIARHRYSTDDVVVAWEAFREAYRLQALGSSGSSGAGSDWAPACADIGCGLGSVLLMLQWMLPNARSVGIEAQSTRLDLAQTSIVANGCSHRCVAMQGDLRNNKLAAAAAKSVSKMLSSSAAGSAAIATDKDRGAAVFDIVTGTPPYFDPAVLGQPADAESSACLFETRGGIEAYCAAARKLLRPAGARPLGLEHPCSRPSASASASASPSLASAKAVCLDGVDCDGAVLPYPPTPSASILGLSGARLVSERAHTGTAAAADAASEAAWWQLAGGRFVVVETALACGRCYHAAAANQLVVERRLDLIGREGKEALICVLVMARAEESGADARAVTCGSGRLTGAVYGEEVAEITVRGAPPAALRTVAYKRLLAETGKPSD
jgi:hypothetical protein